MERPTSTSCGMIKTMQDLSPPRKPSQRRRTSTSECRARPVVLWGLHVSVRHSRLSCAAVWRGLFPPLIKDQPDWVAVALSVRTDWVRTYQLHQKLSHPGAGRVFLCASRRLCYRSCMFPCVSEMFPFISNTSDAALF